MTPDADLITLDQRKSGHDWTLGGGIVDYVACSRKVVCFEAEGRVVLTPLLRACDSEILSSIEKVCIWDGSI
jgi:hypothetical protein